MAIQILLMFFIISTSVQANASCFGLDKLFTGVGDYISRLSEGRAVAKINGDLSAAARVNFVNTVPKVYRTKTGKVLTLKEFMQEVLVVYSETAGSTKRASLEIALDKNGIQTDRTELIKKLFPNNEAVIDPSEVETTTNEGLASLQESIDLIREATRRLRRSEQWEVLDRSINSLSNYMLKLSNLLIARQHYLRAGNNQVADQIAGKVNELTKQYSRRLGGAELSGLALRHYEAIERIQRSMALYLKLYESA